MDTLQLIGHKTAAARIDVSVATVRIWAASGRLRSVRTADGRTLYPTRAVAELAKKRRENGAKAEVLSDG